MSVVAAVVGEGFAVMGGDAAISSGDLAFRSTPKVERWGPVLIGLVGHCEWIGVFRSAMPSADDIAASDKPLTASQLVSRHVQAVTAIRREVRKMAGDEEVELDALLAWPGGMAVFEATQPIFVADDAFAVGSGSHFAMGAMHATARRRADARVRAGLAAAEARTNGVGGPMTVLTVRDG